MIAALSCLLVAGFYGSLYVKTLVFYCHVDSDKAHGCR